MPAPVPPPETDTEALPNNIRKFRLQKRMSLADLARKTPGAMTTSTLHRLEMGETRLTDSVAQRIAVGLGRHQIELYKDAPGAPARETLATLDPQEERVVDALRRMPPEDKRRLLEIFHAVAPDYFAPKRQSA